MSHKKGNYMFFSNLEQMKRQIDELLSMQSDRIDNLLTNGHDWADDHISVASENLDQVYDFLVNEKGEQTLNKVSFFESKVRDFSSYLKINEKNKKHPKIYDAPGGSKRDRLLDKAAKLYKEGKTEEAAKIRREMEEEERSKKDWKNKPRKDSKVNESKKGGCNLSKETEEKIRKVADKKGYTFSSLKSEYCKGLGAYVSSGSRKGMTAHQWAMARVNAATPSKSWANVKKKK
jgi:hypothetical protein